MDRGALQATVLGVTQSDRTGDQHFPSGLLFQPLLWGNSSGDNVAQCPKYKGACEKGSVNFSIRSCLHGKTVSFCLFFMVSAFVSFLFFVFDFLLLF